MSRRWVFALVLGALAAGIALPQEFPPDLQKSLNLTDAQVQSISDLNQQFHQYTYTQSDQYYQLQSQAELELAKDSPDASVVGNAYAQMEMLQRDYIIQLTQVQGKVAAVLTADQAASVGALLTVERLQSLLSEALCVYLETTPSTTTFAPGAGDVTATAKNTVIFTTPYNPAAYFYRASFCHVPPVPTALTNYLNLTDAQIAAIENAILGNQDYLRRQALKIQELQIQINDLTPAQTIDAAALGADYVAIRQIQQDEFNQPSQLTPIVRSILTDSQKPQLQALDNALQLGDTASEAVGQNILVLPPDLQCGSFPLIGIYSIPFVSAPCGVGQVILDPLQVARP